MAGYIRQDVTNNIADGNVINASDFDNEYNAIEAAFHASTGHTHDGTSAEGAPITKIGPTQDVVASASALTPKTDNTVDLGSSTLEYKDLWIDGTANIDSLVADTADINAGTIDGVSIGSAVRGSGAFTTLDANGNSTLGDAVGDTVTINGTTTFVNAAPTLTPLTASQAVFTNGSKTLVSNSITGTGNVVMSASPTLTGTIGGASMTLSSLTSGRVTYAGASGLLQDSTNLTFNGTDLTVSGAVNAGSVNATTLDLTNLEVTNIKAKDGTASMTLADATGVASFSANPVFSGGTANGVLYLDGSKVATSGSALVFDGTNLGIGGTPTSPYSIHVQRTSAAAEFRLQNTAATWDVGNTAAGAFEIFTAANTSIQFGVNGSEGMRLTSTGLGIGTSSPGQKLTVQGGVNVTSSATLPAAQGSMLFSYESAVNRCYMGDGTGYSFAFSKRSASTTTDLMTLTDTGNLGIGTSSPTQKLDVVGNANVSGFIAINNAGGGIYDNLQQNVFYQTPNGTAFIWRDGASGYAERMRLDSSGNLGIGTTSPSARLHAAVDSPTRGIVSITSATGSTGAQLQVTQSGIEDWALGQPAGVNAFAFWSGRNTGNDGVERMRLDSSGNLGLGVTPSAWSSDYKPIQLGINGSVYGRVATTAHVGIAANGYRNAGGTWTYLSTATASRYDQDAGQHYWYTAPSGTAGNAISFTQAMTLDASGNLLVGITSALQSSSGRGNITLNGSSDAIIAFGNAGVSAGYVFAASDRLEFDAASTRFIQFNTNGSERARITSGGDLLVGDTATIGSARFYVLGSVNNFVGRIRNSNAAPSGLDLTYTTASPNNTGNQFLYCADSTAERASIRSNGGLANYQSNNVDLSDSRTKKDIAPAASMWSKIGALEIVTYKYNDQTHDDVNVGVIAQQVEQVEPVWVDSDGFGETPEDGVPLKTVYTKDITFAAIKALQEAMTRIEQLEARVAALEAQ